MYNLKALDPILQHFIIIAAAKENFGF